MIKMSVFANNPDIVVKLVDKIGNLKELELLVSLLSKSNSKTRCNSAEEFKTNEALEQKRYNLLVGTCGIDENLEITPIIEQNNKFVRRAIDENLPIVWYRSPYQFEVFFYIPFDTEADKILFQIKYS